MIAVLALLSCKGDPETAASTVCDAGDEVWIERTLPLVLGRRPHGAAEVIAWKQVIAEGGREGALRAMTHDPAYIEVWEDRIKDWLLVGRYLDGSYVSCYSPILLPEDRGELALWLADQEALGSAYPQSFSMADLVRSAIYADDLSAAWRGHLLARQNKTFVAAEELEISRRQTYGQEFMSSYLGRDMLCVQCHNSATSTTDDPNPALDRHWPVPGYFELALWGSHTGMDDSLAYAAFRYQDFLGTNRPWGWFESCGQFASPDQIPEDALGNVGYFIEDLGFTSSAWEIEGFLKDGVDGLARDGLQVADDATVDGPEAFAFLVGMTLVNHVWEESSGHPLVIATGFPRNDDQRALLQRLSENFVEHRFSLQTLLVDVTTEPLYNPGSPATCGDEAAYGLPAVYNPWVQTEEDLEKRANSAGDLVHRHSGRTLIRSIHDILGWPQPASFPAVTDEIQAISLGVGVFRSTAEPASNGISFQSLLSLSDAYGTCSPPTGGASNGCEATPGWGGCLNCACEACTCGQDLYCCLVQWDDACVSLCEQGCGGCGGGLGEVALGSQPDQVDLLLQGAISRGVSVRVLVAALKDRIVARGNISAEEEQILETLLEGDLDRPVAEAGALEGPLRALCGALLRLRGSTTARSATQRGLVCQRATSFGCTPLNRACREAWKETIPFVGVPLALRVF